MFMFALAFARNLHGPCRRGSRRAHAALSVSQQIATLTLVRPVPHPPPRTHPTNAQLWSSKLRPTWKACTAQLNKTTLNLMKVGHTESCRGTDHEHVIKTYETVALSAVRYCTRVMDVPNALEVKHFGDGRRGGVVTQIRLAKPSELDDWIGALRHNIRLAQPIADGRR